MKNILSLILTTCLFVILITNQATAQQKITLLNGKILNPTSYSIGEMFVNYKLEGDNPKKLRLIDKYDVFSVTDANNIEEILYKPVDSIDFTVEEARIFMEGERAASKYFNSTGASVSSVYIGAASGLLGFFSIPVPFAYSLALARKNPKHLPDEFKSYDKNDAFLNGYNKEARNIKFKQSIKYGYLSLGISLTMLVFLTR